MAQIEPAPVELDIRGHVARVRLNRPAALNAIDREMDRALGRIWTQVDDDPEIRVVILSGAGDRAFCAGGDMNDPPTGHDGLSFGGGLTGIGGQWRPLRKPMICAVHGYVLGLGFELAMCADIVLAADDAIFRLPEAKAGVIDHCGVVHRAIRQLPYHVAMAMIVASEPLTAQDALRHGLVNACFARADLAKGVDQWIDKLLACAPLVSQAARAAALDGLDRPLGEALAASYPLISAYRDTADQAEARSAWRERRAPLWSGH
ncbi:enoyl-CoA hydratase/isomerase family protein [Sphingobium fuliginis]|jgi:enoyl-CoA hydratase/carnithine racemase|uniref:Enoyl-CoA hydratase n=1 Tax=Sphingobium fuliginis (strain ATCC 27551) TaxID=336203 RepID=A0A292ZH15_SPHSA|nr:enoyl-CoA hydratase-related protein [Sphingobium fuliginis]QOT70463.1 enoyl-CoA hydratase/isomerase family protein [Sphingobium fuliginis]GAY22140.1 enoyl-CoA hydratase [Sphingobium fuliginis]